jgi:hypothetical protein
MAATRVPKPAPLIFRTVLLLCFYPTAIYDCITNGGCCVGRRCPAVLSHHVGSTRVRYATHASGVCCRWCLPYAADTGSNVAQASANPAFVQQSHITLHSPRRSTRCTVCVLLLWAFPLLCRRHDLDPGLDPGRSLPKIPRTPPSKQRGTPSPSIR